MVTNQETDPKEKPEDKSEETTTPPDKKSSDKEDDKTPAIETLDPSKFKDDETIDLKAIPKGVGIPKYFSEPDSDLLISQVEKDEANLFLTGPFNIGTEKKPVFVSFSAQITWIGVARRFISKQVYIGTEGTSPNKNFWKIWLNECRFWRNQEYTGLVKDPDFIRQCFESQNWKIRFIKDKVISAKKAEGRLMKHNVQLWLGRPLRLREGALLLGQEVPLNPGEASLILGKIKNKTLKLGKDYAHITKYLEKRKKSDLKMAAEAARIAKEKEKESQA